MSTNRSRGFTLIELLVVIAIIGILSAVVLVSLSTARNKGNDAAVQSNLSTIQTQAEVFYGNSNSYNSTGSAIAVCSGGLFSDTTIGNALASAKNSAKGGATGVFCGVNSTGSAYAVIATVNGTTTATTEWCIDSSGVGKYEYVGSPASITACP